MAELVALWLSGAVVRALRDIGVIKHKTRQCARNACRKPFVPMDGRQRYCQTYCSEKERQKRWQQKARKTFAATAPESLNLPNDTLLSSTDLSNRAKRLCAMFGLRTVGDLRGHMDLAKWSGIGTKTLVELNRIRN